METRKCVYCGGVIPADKRADSRFCNNTCKAKHWEKHKAKNKLAINLQVQEQKSLIEKPLEGLRGVIDNKPENKINRQSDVSDVNKRLKTSETQNSTSIEKETEAYKEALEKVKEAQEYIKQAQELIATCNENINKYQTELAGEYSAKTFKKNKVWNVDIMDLQDSLEEEVSFFSSIQQREKELNQFFNIQTRCKKQLEGKLQNAKNVLKKREEILNKTPRYEKKEILSLLNILGSLKEKKIEQEQIRPIETQAEEFIPVEQTGTTEYDETQGSEVVQTNDKIISSRQLRELNYKSLSFQGRWKEFFGQPAVVFHLVVHGKPGEGKSTFCIQFADYLAKHFGRVVYISGEEGFSKTLRDKVINNKIDNPYLFFADISSFEQIKEQIVNNFHFIFIDSLDTLRIDAIRLRELREHFPQSAFITISQSTKDGKMRGSQEIIHDTDIAVKVEDGIAMTTKNRYNPRGTEFRVFAVPQKLANKLMDDTTNII